MSGEKQSFSFSDRGNTPKQKRSLWKMILFFIIAVEIYNLAADFVGSVFPKDEEVDETVVSQAGDNAEEEVHRAKEKIEKDKDTEKKKEKREFAEQPFPEGAVFITNNDLNKYCANLKGQTVYTVGEIVDICPEYIQLNLGDRFMKSSFYTAMDYSPFFDEGDVVAVSGRVEEHTDYGFLGTSVSLNECVVFSAGENAGKYQYDASDASLAEYLVVTDDVADANPCSNITREEYISLCQSLNYTDILRNPSAFKEKYCKVSGTVDQVIEGWFNTCTLYVKDASGNRWECNYMYSKDESRYLEGDSIVVYGECTGTSRNETLMGKQIIMPSIHVKYLG